MLQQQYFKDRTESFDDNYYYPCINNKKKRLSSTTCICIQLDQAIIYLYNAKIRNEILFKIVGELILT